MNARFGRIAAVTALAAASLMGAATAAQAAERVTTTEDVAGTVFHCADGDYTVTAGTLSVKIGSSIDANGITHLTVTMVPHGVALTGPDGGSYLLSGAGWFGAKGVDESTPLVLTATDHYVIRAAAGGGVAAKVQMVSHYNTQTGGFTHDGGTCAAPGGA